MKKLLLLTLLIGCEGPHRTWTKLPSPKYGDTIKVNSDFYGNCSGIAKSCREGYNCWVCTFDAECDTGAKLELNTWFKLYVEEDCSATNNVWVPK